MIFLLNKFNLVISQYACSPLSLIAIFFNYDIYSFLFLFVPLNLYSPCFLMAASSRKLPFLVLSMFSVALPLPAGVPLALGLESLHQAVWRWPQPGSWGFCCSRAGFHVNFWPIHLLICVTQVWSSPLYVT